MGKLLIGADPELFWKNEQGFVSVIGKLGGSKDLCRWIDEEGNGVLEDNVAAEFNITPSESVEQFEAVIQKNIDFLRKEAAKYGCVLAEGVASASFPEEQMKDAAAWVFGCEPDYNAWTGEMNPKPHSDDMFLRSCGGHVHIGCGDKYDPCEVVQMCDLTAGVPSILLDNDRRRRSLYGKAGACRFKSYGPEYRTLSNWWIWNSSSIHFIHSRVRLAIDLLDKGVKLSKEDGQLIQGAINDSNMEYVQEIFKRYPEVAV